MESEFSRMNSTALVVAWLRTFTSLPHVLEIADKSRAKTVVDTNYPAAKHQESIDRFLPSLESRHWMINNVIAMRGSKQVVELAGGLSPRGLMLTTSPNIRYIDTDLPDIISCKQVLGNAIVGARQNLHYRELNASKRNDWEKTFPLLDPSQHLAICAEGFMPYLMREELTQICRVTREVLSRFGGYLAATDILTKRRIAGIQRATGPYRSFIEAIQKNTGRDFSDAAFNDYDDAADYFEGLGFRVSVFSHREALPELSCVDKLKLDRDAVAERLESMRTFVLDVAKQT